MKKYELAAEELRHRILHGHAPGDVFPAEMHLVRELGVSITTVRKAMEVLAQEGLLVRSQGRRAVVAEPHGRSGERVMRTALLLLLDEGPFCYEEGVSIQQELAMSGYATSLCTLRPGRPEVLRPQIDDALRKHTFDALVAGPVFGWHEQLAPSFAAVAVPSVFFKTTKAIDANYVAVDMALGAYEAGEHLRRVGCKTIRCFVAPGHDNPWDRLTGLKRLHAEHYADMAWGDFLVHAPGTVEDGYSAALREFEAGRRPDGVIAHNDMCAMGIIMAAKKMGIRIPEEMALIGFDDIANAAKCVPPLSTVQQSKEQMAKEIVGILDASAKGRRRQVRHRVVLQPRLVLRESTLRYAAWVEQRASDAVGA